MANKNKVSRGEIGGNKIRILSTSSTLNKNSIRADYLTSGAKKAFNLLWYAFTQVLILQHFDLEWHIPIKTNVSDYAINRVLSQLTLDDLDQWHLVAYYLHKIDCSQNSISNSWR